VAPTLELCNIGDGWGHARLGNVVIVLHQRSTPDSAIDRSLELIDRAIAKHPTGIALVALFEQGAPAPSSGARRTLSQHLARNASKLATGATIIEGTSMKSMATRTATAMMLLLLRQPCPHKVFDSATTASRYVAPSAVNDASGPLVAEDVLAGIEALRAEINGRSQHRSVSSMS
jgi:hypothetical protein